jgi:signal transduction histidine kinase
VLGRGKGADTVDFTPYNAEEFGVSRRHAMLHPTDTKLFVLDLGSTNGTWKNGHSIGVNTPYSLYDGDLLTLGRLEFVVRIVRRPVGHTATLQTKADLADALATIARGITSQLELDEVLNQALEMANALTAADESSIWLVDQQTGELFLEAERGINDDHIRRMRLPVPDTLAGRVIETGAPVRASQELEGQQIKVKTGYLVEAVLYVPLSLVGVTFGVLSAAHREGGRQFSERDEEMMATIADFAAIAVQNARLYQVTNYALNRRSEDVAALNHALSHDLKNLLNSVMGYASLLPNIEELEEDPAEIAQGLTTAASSMALLVDQLLELTTLSDLPHLLNEPCQLDDAVARAVSDMEGAALAKSINLSYEVVGTPYMIQGDTSRLYRSVLNLVDNAIKYSPEGAQVEVMLAFGDITVAIVVRDSGPGIPEEELPHVFEKYYRVNQAADGQTGIGLGLALVRATIEAHRGTVSAQNAEGEGAEFIITLPATLRVN